MIDTIFYFCPTQEEYDRTVDTSNGGQGISDKTITFVEDVREIYLNGKGYGKTSTAGLVSDDRLTSTIAALQESLNNTIQQTNTNLDAVEADLLQQLTTAETGIQNTIAVLRSDTEGAISRLKTEVLDDVDEGFVAKANLDTYVTNAVKDGLGISSLADVALKSDITSSEATISTRFQTVEGDVSTLQGGLTTTNSSLATLQAQSDADHAKIAAVADWSGWVEGQPVSFNGGLITQANADGVIAGLIANSNSDVAAAVSAQVTRGTSNITLSADKIYLDANTTLANTIQATQGNIAGFTISNNSLSASQGDYSIELTPYHFATFKNSTLTNEIKSDGSGSIASGGITWNNNGTITLSQEFLRSLFNALHNGAINQDVYGGINEQFTIGQVGIGGNRQRYILFDPATNALNEASYFDKSYDTSYSPRQNLYEQTTDSVFKYSQYATATSNGYQLKGLTDINYPVYGTLQEKQDYYFRSYKITGVFQSGILTSKQYIDPDTNLQKTDLSEVYLDHQIYFIYVPSLSDIAQVNQLDLNKFVGYAVSRSYQQNNPYADYYAEVGSNDHTINMSISSGIYAYITDIVDHGSYTSYTGSLETNNQNYYILPNNKVAINTSSTYNTQYSSNHIIEGTIDHFVFLPSSTYSPGSQYEIFNNPVEGSWGFVRSAVGIDSNRYRIGDIFFSKGIPANQNGNGNNVTANFSSATESFSQSVPSYYLGCLVVYRNGMWIPLPNAICPQPRIWQYRGSETE